MQDAHPFMLSVVIPMYRESDRIESTLRDVMETLRTRGHPSEVILVDDGSGDATIETVRPHLRDRAVGSIQRVVLVRFDRNRGKGAAVRAGLAEARGSWRLMMDADNAARVLEVDRLLAHAKGDVGIVAGSRSVPGSQVDAKGFRRLTGFLFKSSLRVMGLRLARDTQCGFKLYRADLAEAIVGAGVEDRFAFDIEHLLLTRRLGLSVAEVGIRWRHIDGGQISPVIDGLRMLGRAALIRFRDYGDLSLPEAGGGRADAELEAKPAERAAPVPAGEG